MSTSTARHIRSKGVDRVGKASRSERLWVGMSITLVPLLSIPQGPGVNTAHELFDGGEERFRGLHIHDHWSWN